MPSIISMNTEITKQLTISGASRARGKITSAQNISSGVWTLIHLNAEVYDNLGDFNTSTWLFTTPTTGYYLVTANFRLTIGGAFSIGMYVGKNGSTPGPPHAMLPAGTTGQQSHATSSEVLSLTAGDTLGLYGYQNSGVATAVKINTLIENYLTVHRLS